MLKTVRTPRARRTGMTAFMAGCRMGAWRKAKRCLRRASRGFGWDQCHGDAEGFEDIGGAAAGGDGAVAMLGNGGSGGGCGEGGCGGGC